jgi:RND family efflux transporter MFP subunit
MSAPRLFGVCVVLSVAFSGCTHDRSESGDAQEWPTLDVTHWSEKTELFMEYPVLVSGRTSLFAVHLTRLDDFTPVDQGRARVEFTPESGGQPMSLDGPSPSRPGAFRVEEPAPAAGRYRWALVLESPALSDRHDLGMITVFADQRTAIADHESHAAKDDPAAIAYLKEQQWTSPFAAIPVEEAEFRTAVRAPATIHPLPGGEAVVAAPAAGRFTAARLLSIGDRVKAGQLLGQLEPRLAAGPDRATLDAEVAEARAALDGARLEQTRAERLLAERAVPARRVEDARRAAVIAEARLRAAEARLAQRDETLRAGGGAAAGNAFALRAPISGRLAGVSATLGASYDEGATLFRIVRTDRVALEVQVLAADVAAARQTADLALELPGTSTPIALDPHHVYDSGVIDDKTRALGLQMEVANPGEKLLIGQVGTAVLFTRGRHRLAAVPDSAVLTEAGRPFVFVQEGGERFSRRFVEIASREGNLVGIKNGVIPGERVVTRGAYEVQLASAARGLPAEGHVH